MVNSANVNSLVTALRGYARNTSKSLLKSDPSTSFFS